MSKVSIADEPKHIYLPFTNENTSQLHTLNRSSYPAPNGHPVIRYEEYITKNKSDIQSMDA